MSSFKISAPLFLNNNVKNNKALNPKNALAAAIDIKDTIPNKQSAKARYLFNEVFIKAFPTIYLLYYEYYTTYKF